jgi:hypothetical protein
VRFDGDTAWLSIVQMAELFQRDRSASLRQIGNVFEEGELDRGATCAKSAQVQREGDREVSRRAKSHPQILKPGWPKIETYGDDVSLHCGATLAYELSTGEHLILVKKLERHLL